MARPHDVRHRPPPVDDLAGRRRSSCSRTARSPRAARTTSCSASRAVPRDRREGPARPGLPHPQAARAQGGRACEPSARDASPSGCAGRSRRRLRGTSGRGRKLRGLVVLLRPYRTRVVLDVRRARRRAPPRRSRPPPLAKLGDRRRHPHGRPRRRSTSSSSRFVVSALVVWGATYAQTYLVGWVGQRALQDLRLADLPPPAGAAGRLLRAPPGGRAHLADDQRRRGARLARHRHVVTLFQAVADAARHGRDPALARRRARAADVPDLPGDGDRVAGLPHRLGRRLPAHARDDRRDHRLPAGDAVGHPRRARVRAGAAPPRALRRAQRRQPRRRT